MTVGHMFIVGGDTPEVKRVQTGLLGADYKIENGRYRFARVYNGENWNPQLKAPLTQPGVNVVAGEYLLAVNGRDVSSADNVYSFFEATAGKSVLLKRGARSFRRQCARSDRGAGSERDQSPQSRLDRGQPAQSRSDDERPGGLCLPSGYVLRRVHEFQPLLLRPGGQGSRHYRRALQWRRLTGHRYHRVPQAAADERGAPSRRSRHASAAGSYLRPEGDDHQ